ncbi:hypothetical protein DXG03_004695, partial [Asterophora parasitica]
PGQSKFFAMHKDTWNSKLQLSDKERNELLEAGKCFKCKETGHVSQHCPKGTYVRSDKSGKAPGIPNFSIGIDLKNAEQARELAETTEELYGIGVGSISFDTIRYPKLKCLNFAQQTLGDCAADIAMRQLQAAQPYPGDPWNGSTEEHRFSIGSDGPSQYCIMDSENEDEFVYISAEMLNNPEFNLPLWYATTFAERMGLGLWTLPVETWLDFKMGDVLAHGLAWALHDNIKLLPHVRFDTPDGQRFTITEQDDSSYQITDYGEHTVTRIRTSILRNPKLRIADWYSKRVRRARYLEGLWNAEPGREPPEYLPIGDITGDAASTHLNNAAPYPGDPDSWIDMVARFKVIKVSENMRNVRTILPEHHLEDDGFDVIRWYFEAMRNQPVSDLEDTDYANEDYFFHNLYNPSEQAEIDFLVTQLLNSLQSIQDEEEGYGLRIFGVQIPQGSLAAIERNAVTLKDFSRVIPKPIVVVAHISGKPVRALIDSGSLGDFMSTTLADQLKVE